MLLPRQEEPVITPSRSQAGQNSKSQRSIWSNSPNHTHSKVCRDNVVGEFSDCTRGASSPEGPEKRRPRRTWPAEHAGGDEALLKWWFEEEPSGLRYDLTFVLRFFLGEMMFLDAKKDGFMVGMMFLVITKGGRLRVLKLEGSLRHIWKDGDLVYLPRRT